MKLVKHLLDNKGRHVISVAPDTSVLDAIKVMADKAIGSLVVMQDDQLLGIMSERDYARKVIIKGRSSESTHVSEIMTADVITASSSHTVNECMNLMTEDNQVIGMISIGDQVEAIISDQQEEIEQLESYISG